MILNAYSVLAAFVGLVELVLGVLVAGFGVSAIRRRRASRPPDGPGESDLTLLFLLSAVLLGVSVASWPLLYLMLDSYVPQWPGVMCIQGVTRIGTGSLGPAGWLPTLVRVLEFTKPALLFATGAWLVLHLANRRTRTAPLTGRVLAALVASGILASLDAAAQLAYVGIPKKESFLARGCCATVPDIADRTGSGTSILSSASATPESSHPWLPAAFWAVTAAMVVGTWWAARRRPDPPARAVWGPAALFLGALVSVPVGLAFLDEVAAPLFLRLPDHHCAYCLLSSSPLGVVDIALYALGVFAVGWSCIAQWFGGEAEARPGRAAQVSALLHAGLFGYLGALLLTSARLAVA